MIPLDKELQWVNVKQKPFRQIQAHSGIIRHIQELFRHIQAYSQPCVTLAYFGPWYIQNSKIFRTRSIFRTLAHSKSKAYSEPCKTCTMKRFAKIVNGCYFCRINLPRSLLPETNVMRQLFYVENYGAREDLGPWIFDIPIDIFK